MAEDAVEVEEAPAVEGMELSKIQAIAVRQLTALAVVTDLQAQLQAAQQVYKAIAEKELPNAMAIIGLRDFTLDSGHSVSLVVSHHTGLTKENEPAGFAWLKEKGLDDIIKRQLTVQFGRGEGETADVVGEKIKELAPENKFEDKASVHWATLKSTILELIAEGETVPMDIFGVYTTTVAEIEAPNAKKEKVKKNIAGAAAEF